MPRRVGKTTMLEALALGYSQLKGNRVLLMPHNSHRLVENPLYYHKNIDIISSERIKVNPDVLRDIKYDVILIDEMHRVNIPELVHILRLDERVHTLKAFVMVR